MTDPIRERIQAVLPGPWYNAGPEYRLDLFPRSGGQNHLCVVDVHGLWIVGIRMNGERILVSRGDLQAALEDARADLRTVNRSLIDALALVPRPRFIFPADDWFAIGLVLIGFSVCLAQVMILVSMGAAQ